MILSFFTKLYFVYDKTNHFKIKPKPSIKPSIKPSSQTITANAARSLTETNKKNELDEILADEEFNCYLKGILSAAKYGKYYSKLGSLSDVNKLKFEKLGYKILYLGDYYLISWNK